MQIVITEELGKLCRNGEQVFLGFGFDWLPLHSQRLYELAKVNSRDYAVSPALLRWLGYEVDPQPDHEIRLPYIHGVGPHERALYQPLQNFEGR
jgi:conjugal transfer pilus assembly protein TraD